MTAPYNSSTTCGVSVGSAVASSCPPPPSPSLSPHLSAAPPDASSSPHPSTEPATSTVLSSKSDDQSSAGFMQLKVASFNVLSQTLAVSAQHSFLETEHAAWTHRAPLIAAAIAQLDADIVCLQEVTVGMCKDLAALLAPAHMQIVWEGPPDAPHGHPFVFRRRKCYLRRRPAVFLLGGCMVTEVLAKSALTPRHRAVHERMSYQKQFAVVAHFGVRDWRLGTCAEIVVVNTHLASNQDWPEVRTAQAYFLTQYVAQWIGPHHRGGAVVCGDLNSVPASDAYMLLTTGVSKSQSLTGRELRNPVGPIVSAHAWAHGLEPPWTTRTPAFTGTLDYVMVTPHTTTVTDAGVAMPCSAHDASVSPWMPNAYWPSDHVPVWAVVQVPCVESSTSGSGSGSGTHTPASRGPRWRACTPPPQSPPESPHSWQPPLDAMHRADCSSSGAAASAYTFAQSPGRASHAVNVASYAPLDAAAVAVLTQEHGVATRSRAGAGTTPLPMPVVCTPAESTALLHAVDEPDDWTQAPLHPSMVSAALATPVRSATASTALPPEPPKQTYADSVKQNLTVADVRGSTNCAGTKESSSGSTASAQLVVAGVCETDAVRRVLRF